jgi:hypothetical protein
MIGFPGEAPKNSQIARIGCMDCDGKRSENIKFKLPCSHLYQASNVKILTVFSDDFGKKYKKLISF